MTSIHFVLRPSIRQGHYPGSLCARLIHARRVKTVTLKGFHLYPEEWDSKTQRIIYPENNPNRVTYLKSLESKYRDKTEMLLHQIRILERQERYSVDDLISLYLECRDNGRLANYTRNLAASMEKQGQARTAAAYRTVTRGLIKFNKGKDIPLKQITPCLIKEFEKHLKETGRLPNTISYYMRNLRAIFNKAVKDKRISRPEECPFANVYKSVTKTMKRALSLEELQLLYELDLKKTLEKQRPGTKEYATVKNLQRSRLYFEFCFFARGMSFVDMALLRKENIRGGFIRYVRKKTGQQMDVKVTPEIEEIMNKFSDEVRNSPYVFPLIHEGGVRSRYLQYETALRLQNYRLKKLAALAGIDKPLSTHWARHSWASIGKKQDLPVRVISECLGHTSEKTTRIYLDSLDNSLLDAANHTVTSALRRIPSCLSPMAGL